MLTRSFGVLSGLLISEDNAMALGAGLLFLILAAIMVVTRTVSYTHLDVYKGQGLAGTGQQGGGKSVGGHDRKRVQRAG